MSSMSYLKPGESQSEHQARKQRSKAIAYASAIKYQYPATGSVAWHMRRLALAQSRVLRDVIAEVKAGTTFPWEA